MNRIIALHGFLGSPKDFSPLGLSGLLAPDLFRMPIGPMKNWAKRFNHVCPDGATLLGYSMGARLAIHCLLADPHKYKAAIILAAHPGFPSPALRMMRLKRDYCWAKKFVTMPWHELMSAWNHQIVFSNSQAVLRQENDFRRAELSTSLRCFSVGQQEYLIPQINDLNIPILWLAPEQETRHVDGLMLKNPLSKLEIIPEGGHRFMFERPKLVADHINEYLQHPHDVDDI